MAKKHKSVSAAQKAGSIYFYDKNGTKKLAVTAEQLNAWKKKNKGKYKGSALTAWANNKGKDVGAPKKKEEIQVRKLSPATVGKGRGDGEMELFQRKVDKRKAQMADSPGEGSDKSITYEGGAAAQREGANTPNKRGPQPPRPAPDNAPKLKDGIKEEVQANKGGMMKKKKSGYAAGGMTKKKVMTYNLGGMVKSQINNLKKGKS